MSGKQIKNMEILWKNEKVESLYCLWITNQEAVSELCHVSKGQCQTGYNNDCDDIGNIYGGMWRLTHLI